LPNYYLILIINIILAKHALIGGNIEHFNYKFFLFIQNFSEPFVGFFWESWSLSIEEWFYIFLPLALILSLKLFPSKKGILLAIIILILAPLVYRVMHSSENVNFFWWDVKFRKVILMRLDTIIFGVLAAYIKFYHLQIWKKYAVFSFIIGMILIISISYLPIEINDFFTKTFYFSLISFAAMLLLPYADSMKSFSTFFGKIITHISLISYSMYLVNLSLVSSIIRINFPVSDPMNGLLKYFLYWFIVISISTLLYLFFEKPMMNLRDKNIFTRKKSIRQL
ncbi:MAG: acyltransferase family protein, partial [Bacteroidales bacterium]|nr:acyltransferase family protein [Bacteroidales bacterium]